MVSLDHHFTENKKYIHTQLYEFTKNI
jgi:hypothetical protein